MQLGFTIGPCLFPSIIWQNYGNPLSNAGRLPCSSTMGAFTPLPKGLFTAMQPWVEVSHRKPHRARQAPAETQRFNENKEARPRREEGFNVQVSPAEMPTTEPFSSTSMEMQLVQHSKRSSFKKHSSLTQQSGYGLFFFF